MWIVCEPGNAENVTEYTFFIRFNMLIELTYNQVAT